MHCRFPEAACEGIPWHASQSLPPIGNIHAGQDPCFSLFHRGREEAVLANESSPVEAAVSHGVLYASAHSNRPGGCLGECDIDLFQPILSRHAMILHNSND